LLEEDKIMPSQLFELAVLPVRVLLLEEDRIMPSQLFELAVLPIRVLLLLEESRIMP
jgi:hypothetical protein